MYFDEVYFYDFTINPRGLSNREAIKIKDYRNPNFWCNIDKGTRYKRKQDYNKIVVKHSQNIKAQISDLISKKWDELSTKKGDHITDILKVKKATNLPLVYRKKKSLSLEAEKEASKRAKKPGVSSGSPRRVCEVKKLDISMQKKGSKFLCFTGLKYYWKHEQKIFEKLEREYLPASKRGLNLEDKIYFIAHNIRNTKNNQRHNRAKFEERNYPLNQLRFNF